MFLPAQKIRERCYCDPPLISPFSERTECGGVTYGLGPASYDLRIDRAVVLYPGRSVCADAVEYIHMPDDLIGMLFSKSTWSRVHVEHSGNIIDPGFYGVLRLELNMHYGDAPIYIPAGAGVVQVLFGQLTELTSLSYKGKYQGQAPDQDAVFVGDCLNCG